MAHELTWYGHSAFKLATAGKTLLIDPFLDGNPTSPASARNIGPVDCILVTHDHGDHVGQALEIARSSGATVVGVFDTIGRLTGEGLPEAQAAGMNIGGTVEVCGARAKMVQAAHSSATGTAAGYIITLADGFCLYHAGDTGLFATMGLFPTFHDIDLALLPIGGHFTMDAEQAAYAARLLRAKSVCPMHWGTFPVLEQNTAGFAEQLARAAPDTRLHVLTPGKPMRIEKAPGGFECGCD